ncbi:tyrosine-type recombinase/integrase [Microbacterium maritypicum]|uniref:tyrosine-type recombinase/integrase n=1 Tax=Microbacterium maritypicum TaxID=33918 RepID=UPI0026711575|nr:tyrosine-type recombinase/integrase [Microbacterium liquefaciens]WKT89574.1 tyrosine-type recombinase/integrase [Microbacterium liquefaciens]
MASAVKVKTPERWAVVDDKGVPLGDVTAFLRYQHSIEHSPNTIRAYASDLAHFHSFLESESTVWTAVTNEVLARFIAFMRTPSPELVTKRNPAGKRTKATVNRSLSAVSSFALFLADARGDDVYSHLLLTARRSKNKYAESGRPVVRVGPRLKETEQVRHVLLDAEVTSIIDACNRLRDKFLFALLYETGMRIGQALLLRHSDIRVSRSSVRVFPEEDDVVESDARNKSTTFAEVPVPAYVIRMYAAYQHSEHRDVDSDFVFVNLWAGEIGRPMTYHAVDRLVVRLRKKSGVTRWSPHTFRHTYITRLLSRGVSPSTVAYLATHATVMTTLETYNHVDVESVRNEIQNAGVWN